MTADWVATRQVLPLIAVVASYFACFYSIAKHHRENKTIIWGCITLFIFFLSFRIMRFTGIPDWFPGSIVFLGFLLGLYTIVLAGRDVARWAKQRKQ